MRRFVAAAIVTFAGLAGSAAVLAPAAHAAGQACVNAHVVVNGTDVVNQSQCVAQ